MKRKRVVILGATGSIGESALKVAREMKSDQILIVTEGTGVVATDKEERTVSVGDIILIPAGENHWHGAPGATPMSHITVQAKGSTTQQNEP